MISNQKLTLKYMLASKIANQQATLANNAQRIGLSLFTSLLATFYTTPYGFLRKNSLQCALKAPR